MFCQFLVLNNLLLHLNLPKLCRVNIERKIIHDRNVDKFVSFPDDGCYRSPVVCSTRRTEYWWRTLYKQASRMFECVQLIYKISYNDLFL